MPHSICRRTVSATASRTRFRNASSSTGSPVSRFWIMSARSCGRGRLPVCVVRIRSVLRFIFLAPPSLAERLVREGGDGKRRRLGFEDHALAVIEQEHETVGNGPAEKGLGSESRNADRKRRGETRELNFGGVD